MPPQALQGTLSLPSGMQQYRLGGKSPSTRAVGQIPSPIGKSTSKSNTSIKHFYRAPQSNISFKHLNQALQSSTSIKHFYRIPQSSTSIKHFNRTPQSDTSIEYLNRVHSKTFNQANPYQKHFALPARILRKFYTFQLV